jgi:hypothetical protein
MKIHHLTWQECEYHHKDGKNFIVFQGKVFARDMDFSQRTYKQVVDELQAREEDSISCLVIDIGTHYSVWHEVNASQAESLPNPTHNGSLPPPQATPDSPGESAAHSHGLPRREGNAPRSEVELTLASYSEIQALLENTVEPDTAVRLTLTNETNGSSPTAKTTHPPVDSKQPLNASLPVGDRHTLNANRQPALDEQLIQICEQELTRIIGPIAKLIVARERGASLRTSPSMFVDRLAAEIPDSTRALEFRQQMAKLLPN